MLLSLQFRISSDVLTYHFRILTRGRLYSSYIISYICQFFSDMLTSDDRKEVDLHLQRGSIARDVFHDILELVYTVV